MKVIGTKTVAITKLHLPGDFESALSAEVTSQIASSYEAIGGHIQDPVVRLVPGGGYQLIAGRKRTAAHVQRGDTHLEVKVVECTDDEAELIELIENACRRHDQDEQASLMVRLVNKLEADVVREREEAPPDQERPRRPGRPKTPRGEARERAAAATGVKPESVRKAEQRAREREAKREAESSLPIETFGMPVDEPFLDEVRLVQTHVRSILGRLNLAMGEAKQLLNAEADFPENVLQRVRERVREAATALRAMEPRSLCPYCKGIGELQEECTACHALGWVGVIDSVPKELLRAGKDTWVMDRGELVKITDVIDFDQPATFAEDLPAAPEPERDRVAEAGMAAALDYLEEDEETQYEEAETVGDGADLPW